MTISAKIVADSVSPHGIRLTTMQLRYPRFIHSEFMTHRVFSRNASSSRAIPVAKMIEDLRRDPAMPIYWGSNKPGMQAGEELDGQDLRDAQNYWLDAMNLAINEAEKLVELGLHKQIANRILEPWAHINVVVTATDWANFFALRAHEDAQPEIRALTLSMAAAMSDSTPNHLVPGQWHLPYVNQETLDTIGGTSLPWLETARKVSVSRCARVSYFTHDGRDTSIEEDTALYDRLLVSEPLHASPAEHQATPDRIAYQRGWGCKEFHGNLRGWIQFRKTLEGEFVSN